LKSKQSKQTKPQSKAVWLILGGLILLGGIAWFSMRTSDTQPQETQVQMPPPLKLTTLPPSMFLGRAREAYQAALDIPEVLQQVQCYCGCKLSAGHENNLFCFTDGHGAG
jgi:hypothetical protein